MPTRRCDTGCGRPTVQIDSKTDLGFCLFHNSLYLALLADRARKLSAASEVV